MKLRLRTLSKFAHYEELQNSHPAAKLSFSKFAKQECNADIAGLGTTVHGIGIDALTAHVKFEVRASWGTVEIDEDVDEGGNGRGTHTAGITGGRVCGVAKSYELVAAKAVVVNGYDGASAVAKAVNWITKQHHMSVACFRSVSHWTGLQRQRSLLCFSLA